MTTTQIDLDVLRVQVAEKLPELRESCRYCKEDWYPVPDFEARLLTLLLERGHSVHFDDWEIQPNLACVIYVADSADADEEAGRARSDTWQEALLRAAEKWLKL